MTEDEKQEVDNVVSLLDSVNSRELVNFCTQETKPRHRSVDESELDRLAGKNNTFATNYQTKWAITVFKGTYDYYSVILYHL